MTDLKNEEMLLSISKALESIAKALETMALQQGDNAPNISYVNSCRTCLGYCPKCHHDNTSDST